MAHWDDPRRRARARVLTTVAASAPSQKSVCAVNARTGRTVSELSERKSWQAYTFEAVEFAKGAGGPDMSAENRLIYEGMVAAANAAADRHDAARAADATGPSDVDDPEDAPY